MTSRVPREIARRIAFYRHAPLATVGTDLVVPDRGGPGPGKPWTMDRLSRTVSAIQQEGRRA